MKKILVLLLFLALVFPQTAFAKKKGAAASSSDSAATASTKPAKTSAVPNDSGYVGSLPNITDRFKTSEPEEAKPSFEYEDGFNDQDDIKPAPRNNPAFINIIMKKDKTSQYLNDLNSLISIIEKLQSAIEDKESVQKFNSESYFFKGNVEYFRDKYQKKAEESYISFKKVMQLNMHVQAVAQLRLEKEVYSPYVTNEQNGNLFSQNNINNQLDYLLDEIKSTLVVLKETK